MAFSSACLALALFVPAQRPQQPPLDPEATAAGRATFLGREVAHTMHWAGAGWLMRKTREDEENGVALREWLAVKPGQTLCDLGCGNGYHTLPLAEEVGDQGRMFAVDLQPQMLVMLEQRTADAQLDNVEFVEATIDDPKLPQDSCDLVLMVDVYHELSHPVRVMRRVRAALREGGEVVLVEFRAEDPSVPIKPEHMMSKAQVIREMASHGFSLSRETDALPWQHAMAFTPVDAPGPEFAPRQLLRGFGAAVRGVDPRVARAFLAQGTMLPQKLTPPNDEATVELVAGEDGAARASWPDSELTLKRDQAGRWQVTAVAPKPRRFDPVIRDLHGFTVHVDPALLSGPNAKQGARALSMLSNHLERISILVPSAPLSAMRSLGIWIEHEHPELSNMQYHPGAGWLERRGYDPRLAKKVHIPRARALLSRAQMLKHPAVVLHELAHAYHDQVLGFEDARIVEAFRAARAARTYENVLAHTGRKVRHYAMTNHKEYFAEATEAYLYRNDFFPFVRAEFEQVDPKGHAALQEIWGPAR